MSDQSPPIEQASRRYSRGRFPRYSLSQALPLVQAVYSLGHGDEVRRTHAFDAINRASDSGPSNTLMTSVRGYGLLEPTANGTRLLPTERGIALVNEESEDVRRAHAWGAMITNDIFREFVQKYVDRPLPSDEVVIDALMAMADINGADARACFKVFMANLTDYGLVENAGGKRVIVSPEVNLTGGDSVGMQESAGHVANAATSEDAPAHTSATNLPTPSQRVAANWTGELQPQIAFNIQIQLPENASEETYDAIFRNIAVHLLGRSEG